MRWMILVLALPVALMAWANWSESSAEAAWFELGRGVDPETPVGVRMEAAVVQVPPASRPGLRARAGRLPQGATMTRDVEYLSVDGVRLALDVYQPDAAKFPGPRPLVIWVHGGGWAKGSRVQTPALFLLEDGYAVASISYRLSGVAKWPAQIQDCKAAVRFLRANAAKYSLDGGRFAAWGSSAGGHLVAMLGTSGDVKELEHAGQDVKVSSRVQAVVDFFGPTDFLRMKDSPSQMDHESANSPESQLIGGKIADHPDRVKSANPITYISADDPPFLIMHGDRDPLVPHSQSELLEAALKAAKVPVEFKTVKGAGHGFGGAEIEKQVREFLDGTIGKPATRPAK